MLRNRGLHCLPVGVLSPYSSCLLVLKPPENKPHQLLGLVGVQGSLSAFPGRTELWDELFTNNLLCPGIGVCPCGGVCRLLAVLQGLGAQQASVRAGRACSHPGEAFLSPEM